MGADTLVGSSCIIISKPEMILVLHGGEMAEGKSWSDSEREPFHSVVY